MEQLSLPLPPGMIEPGQTPLAQLTEQYCQRHRNVENYLLIYFLVFGLLRRLRLVSETQRLPAQLVAVLLVAAAVIGPPVVVTALLDEWTIAPIATWTAIGFSFGLLVVLMHTPLVRALDNFLALHRAIADEPGLRRLIAWERHWFRRRVVAPIAFLFSIALLLYLYYVEIHYGERPMAWGTALVGFLLLYGVGEIVYSVLLLALESCVLRDCEYVLYQLSPLESVALRRAVRGSSQIGLLVSLIATMFIVGFVALLADRPTMVTHVGLFLVGLAYLAMLTGVLLPRLTIKAIVQTHKEKALAPLQRRLDELAAHMGELSEEQYGKYRRLKETHDTIRYASEEVLPLRALGRLLGALVLPTVTFVASRFGETILQGITHQLHR